jgi:hypothetical protein
MERKNPAGMTSNPAYFIVVPWPSAEASARFLRNQQKPSAVPVLPVKGFEATDEAREDEARRLYKS